MVTRKIYSTLDFLSDVGGVVSIALLFITQVVSFVNFDYLMNTLISQVYLTESLKGALQRRLQLRLGLGGDEEKKRIRIGCSMRYTGFCAAFCGCCCRGGQRRRALEQARKEWLDETDIVSIVRRQRLMQMALNYLVPQKKLAEFKRLS